MTAGLILPTPTALFASSILTGSFVSADTKSALEGLVKRCYDGLSYHSRQGHKGALLSQLLAMVTMNPNLTEPQMNHVLLELIHVTASYRETFFCQAAYGQTRSAKVLIAAIKDQALNSKLPLASMIVDASDGMADTPLTDDVILKRLQGLREKRGWEKAVSKVNVPWGAPVATP